MKTNIRVLLGITKRPNINHSDILLLKERLISGQLPQRQEQSVTRMLIMFAPRLTLQKLEDPTMPTVRIEDLKVGETQRVHRDGHVRPSGPKEQ
eukprot:5420815-Amphidinium_carterae.1